ncbi:matrix metalloproteinase-19-like [Ptychodera flava]|uniref:matrix metalloproteinase-19-like n=1 Tax=Ptychodera flava TaxID=63121 RepID=UPI00396A5075
MSSPTNVSNMYTTSVIFLCLLVSICRAASLLSDGGPLEGEIREKRATFRRRRPNKIDPYDYLSTFGYLASPTSEGQSGPMGMISATEAIRNFQKMADIPQTGKIDRETKRQMELPRCGVPDSIDFVPKGLNGGGSKNRRSKRYIVKGRKWNKFDLTYRIVNFTKDLEESEVKSAIERAFKLWSAVSPLTFTEVTSGEADIAIKFVTGNHGDGKKSAFDGPGRVLAHAFFPKNGAAHFDDAELFTVYQRKGRNLYSVAAHEFGHSLGLGHSETKGSLMYPVYQKYKPDYKLSQDDILGIQALYGEPNGDGKTENDDKEQPTAQRITTEACREPFDATFSDKDGNIFLVGGMHMWKTSSDGVMDGVAKKIKTVYRGLPSNINAAVTSSSTGWTYFFKGDRYWVYNGQRLRPGFPKKIKRTGLPNKPDAALEWGGKIYIFKGAKYYEWDEFSGQVSEDFPKKIERNWAGVPTDVDAAVSWKGGKTYFFKGNKYWRYDDSKEAVDSEYPKNRAVYWMNCGGRSMRNRELKRASVA